MERAFYGIFITVGEVSEISLIRSLRSFVRFQLLHQLV